MVRVRNQNEALITIGAPLEIRQNRCNAAIALHMAAVAQSKCGSPNVEAFPMQPFHHGTATLQIQLRVMYILIILALSVSVPSGIAWQHPSKMKSTMLEGVTLTQVQQKMESSDFINYKSILWTSDRVTWLFLVRSLPPFYATIGDQ